jgi:glycosyltransferase involved in cell wall biosynthesis
MTEPRVSAVIVVHNGERYLGAAIDSVLVQRPRPFEVIVIDDGSTDETAALAAGFGSPVRCVSQARRGIGAARNAGIALSRGDFVAFLDSDDLWTPESLGCLLAAFATEPGLELAFGRVRQFISPDVQPGASQRLVVRDDLEPGYLVGAVLIRRAALERVGSFCEQVSTGDFLDWIARAREAGVREALVPEHVLWRRVHESNHGLIHADRRTDYARILKRALDRRRAAAARAQED